MFGPVSKLGCRRRRCDLSGGHCLLVEIVETSLHIGMASTRPANSLLDNIACMSDDDRHVCENGIRIDRS